MIKDQSILLLGKGNDEYSHKAIAWLRAYGLKVEAYVGKRTHNFPLKNDGRSWDWVISYLSPWVIPDWLLARAKKAAINFHPGPPEYPGIGCTNFAIYNEEKIFGITCHHMISHVDSGAIIEVKRFPIYPSDNVFELTKRCYIHIFELFKEIVMIIQKDCSLPSSAEQWKRKAYTRSELDALCVIRPDMSETEIQRRLKATTFPGMPGAYVILGKEKFLAREHIERGK